MGRVWCLAALSVSLLACSSESEEDKCGPYASTFDCGRADDWWRPPAHHSFASLDVDTLVCSRSEWDSACNNPEGDCCCGSTMITNRVTTVVEPAECANDCTGLGEATCLVTTNCFVAREDGTNTYLGCFGARNAGYVYPCVERSDAEHCGDSGACVALYTSTGMAAWQFSACTDE
jgi:hypothetical protein